MWFTLKKSLLLILIIDGVFGRVIQKRAVPAVVGVIGVGVSIAEGIRNASRRTVEIANNDICNIEIECCQKGECRGRKVIQPGHSYAFSFIPNVRTLWWCTFRFADESGHSHYDVWKGHGNSKRYTIRKDRHFFKANLNGSNEKYIKNLGK